MTPDQLAKSGTEHAEQRALFAWANMAAKYGLTAADDDKSYTVPFHAQQLSEQTPLGHQKYLPQLEWLHAIHNQGHGDVVRGGKAKAEGVKAGIADCFLPWPVNRLAEGLAFISNISIAAAGCYIEMKRNVTTDIEKLLSDEQKAYRVYCNQVGYAWYCARGWREARQYLLEYLGLI